MTLLQLLHGAAYTFVHDSVLPHHTPVDCTCRPWSANASSAALWGSPTLQKASGAACAMPANALTPDLALPIESPSDGWCLCDGNSSDWYTWCAPPAAYPSQINLLIVNSSSVVVNFVTADEGERAGCVAEAELVNVMKQQTRTTTHFGYSTLYHDSEGSRHLSYHHTTLSGLRERSEYRYRVRVSNVTAGSPPAPTPPPQPITWVETKGIKWCSGGNLNLGFDPFGQGFDGEDTHCPWLPSGVNHDVQVAMCEEVCAAKNMSDRCAGFTYYPPAVGAKRAECCFRTDTSSKPADPSSSAECYEKHGGATPPPAARACAAAPSEWSEWRNFTSLYASGVTRFALYADMGVFVAEGELTPPVKSLPAMARHNVGNLVDDLNARPRLIDFAIHSGDHAYQFESNGGARGDGYMDGYSAFLSHAPWAPGWGNHEYLELDRGNRLANITAGLIAERAKAVKGTSRMFYSVEVGLLHLLHLDLTPYWERFSGCIDVDSCGFPDEWVRDSKSKDPKIRYDFEGYRAAALAFARADLAAVDRKRTPWIIVTSHFPFYDTYDDRVGGTKGGSYSEGTNASKAQAIADFEPLLLEFAVDIYFAGHNHNYETTWPMAHNMTVGPLSYIDPRAPIHILSGTAGPPAWDAFKEIGAPWTREPRILANSYSRMTLWNASVATFEQVGNDNGTLLDSWTIVQRRRNRSAPFKVRTTATGLRRGAGTE